MLAGTRTRPFHRLHVGKDNVSFGDVHHDTRRKTVMSCIQVGGSPPTYARPVAGKAEPRTLTGLIVNNMLIQNDAHTMCHFLYLKEKVGSPIRSNPPACRHDGFQIIRFVRTALENTIRARRSTDRDTPRSYLSTLVRKDWSNPGA